MSNQSRALRCADVLIRIGDGWRGSNSRAERWAVAGVTLGTQRWDGSSFSYHCASLWDTYWILTRYQMNAKCGNLRNPADVWQPVGVLSVAHRGEPVGRALFWATNMIVWVCSSGTSVKTMDTKPIARLANPSNHSSCWAVETKPTRTVFLDTNNLCSWVWKRNEQGNYKNLMAT